MIKQVTQTITALVFMLTLVACAYSQAEFDITGKWNEKDGESTLEFTKEGGCIINFKPALSDGSYEFSSETYERIDNSHLTFTIIMGRASLEIIDVKATIKKNNELRFNLDGKNYRFNKEPEPLFPDGIETITLLSARITPEEITVDGSDLNVYFRNSDSITMTKLVPVVIIVTGTSTITKRTYSSAGLTIKDDLYFTTNVSNPRNTYSYNKGTLTGSGTIYIYLEDRGESTDKDDNKRVSNILSVYATFK